MKGIHKVKVISNMNIAKEMYRISFKSTAIAQEANPGQFIHVKIPGDSALLLRRPISINSIDINKGRVDLIYQKIGKGTEILSRVKENDELDVLGPLGKGFFIPKGVKKVFLIGGGCGVAPLKFVAEKWNQLSFYSFLGFRDVFSSYQVKEFGILSDNILVATNDGSLGKKGVITDFVLDELKNEGKPELVIACGPIAMLKAVKRIAEKYNIPCQVSLEERMGCGVGGCLVCSCAVGTKDNWDYKKVCTDGPVFWSQEVIFDDKSQSRN